MRKIFTLALCLVILLNIKTIAQESYSEEEGFEGKNLTSLHADADWYKLMSTAQPNLFAIQKAYDDYFRTHKFVKSKETRAFEFWKKHIVRDNYDENGNVGKQIINETDLRLISKSTTSKQKVKAAGGANWSRIIISPDMVAPWQSGSYTQGTCNMLAIHPTDTTQMIAAFIDGGTLWRTTDNCKTWTQCATDLLVRHFGSVVYSKSNPNIVYAGSSQAIIKSVDGGATWTVASGWDKRSSYPGGDEIWAMEVKADNPNYMLFAINGTLYRTTNGGTNFSSQTIGSNIRDIRALPDSANVVLLTTMNNGWPCVYRSRDFGSTWKNITNGYPASVSGYTGQMALLAISPAAPKNVWAEIILKNTSTGTGGTYDIYKSIDGGLSFSRMNITKDLTDKFWQGGWNQALAVSDKDTNIIAGGAYSTYVTKDGGKTWFGNGDMGKTGPHSDVHGLLIRDKSVYSSGDGGFYKSVDYGHTYNHNLDDGIQSHCLWGFDQAWKSDIMAIGMYHGPTTLRDDAIYTGWYPGPGADAGDAFVNKGDDRYIYAHPWGNTRITRSTSRSVSPSNTGITHISNGINDMNDPDYYETIYGVSSATGKLMVSSDNASTYTDSLAFTSKVNDYIVALTNNKIAYCRSGNVIMKTSNGGATWTNVSPSSSIISGQNMSNIAVDGLNPDVVWVTFNGKQSTMKVAKTTDGGKTWINYNGSGLPSYSVNCVVSQFGTNGDVYIGTDAGVYYRNNSTSAWTPYNTNLPLATHVGWIKINYAKAKIRIAGQTGIWESDLISPSAPIAHPTTPKLNVDGGKNVQFADMSVCLANATYSWTFPDATPATSSVEKPVVVFNTGGDKNITLTVTDANGTDTRTYNGFVRVRTVGTVAKTGWKVIKYDSQQGPSTAAAYAIDGNTSTVWSTKWSGSVYPHELWVDMGKEISIESFKYLPSTSGIVKGYEWYVTNDTLNWGTPVASGEYAAGTTEKSCTLSTPATGRYFRFKALSEMSGGKTALVAEISINGSNSVISAFDASATLAKPGATINFTDKSAGHPTSWSWSFPGGTPSTSTEQNPVVTYSTEGVFPVTLQVSNASGGDIIEKSSYITISSFVPQTGWKVIYFDSQETTKEQTPATNAIDGSNSSFWGTDWSTTNTACPHEIKVDMGSVYSVNGFNYVPRQNSPNGRIANYQFYISTDNVTWTLVKSGTWSNTATEQSMDFATTNARYFRLVALSEVNGNNWTAVGELKMKMAFVPGSTSEVNNPNIASDVSIYSSSNKIMINIASQNKGQVAIYDVLGHELFTGILNSGITSIENVEEGIYIVKVSINNSTIGRKVVVTQ